MKIGDKVRRKNHPDQKCKIIGICRDRYKIKELSKHGGIWYGLRLEDLEYWDESGKDRPPRD